MDGLGHLTSVARDAVPRPPAGGRAGDRSSKLMLRHSDLWQTLGHEPAPAGMGPLAIGLALTLIHLISIPVTNTSVNPARSTGPALFVGGWALGQLWLFWLAPLVGGAVAGIGYRLLVGTGSEPAAAEAQDTAEEGAA
jgi:hypothetical protein